MMLHIQKNNQQLNTVFHISCRKGTKFIVIVAQNNTASIYQ